MKNFLDKDFLLSTPTACRLYHDYASKMPIIDYHCHINPKDIADNISFDNIAQVWLGGDHYKWRALRACGVEEKYITGNADDYEKFEKWAEIMPKLIGNPLYHWSHLELKRYFGYDGILNLSTASEVWNVCNEKLKNITCRDLIKQSNVEIICTTDDPADSLCYHKQIADSDFDVKVYPTWRPDNLFNTRGNEFCEYINKLSCSSSTDINCLKQLKKAIVNRMDYFDSMGCRVCDHGIASIDFVNADENEIEDIFGKLLSGKEVGTQDMVKYTSWLMTFMAKEYNKRNWTMQLHYGVLRNNNEKLAFSLGKDIGVDCIGDNAPISGVINLLNNLTITDCLPKTIIYSLNPVDNTSIDTAIGCFQAGHTLGRIQHGCAWWFNDNKTGILEHMTSLSNQGVLGNFIGMLTDSRSFLSYTRHEYFRRILCDFIGRIVENGEYPNDDHTLKELIENICYYNAKHFLDFKD